MCVQPYGGWREEGREYRKYTEEGREVGREGGRERKRKRVIKYPNFLQTVCTSS